MPKNLDFLEFLAPIRHYHQQDPQKALPCQERREPLFARISPVVSAVGRDKKNYGKGRQV